MKYLIRTACALALAATLVMTGCRTHKKVVKDPTKAEQNDTAANRNMLEKIKQNQHTAQFVSSKLKFSVEVGAQKLSLTGNLRMKRDDVIRLQLMAFGFVEAGRLEFTQDYVLIMDRINKQYLKVPYQHVDFLRNSGINFFTLQALFWNEIFEPGQQSVRTDLIKEMNTAREGENVVMSLDKNKMNYSWLANEKTGRISLANIMYRDNINGNSQLSWEYRDFALLDGKMFPSDMKVTLTTPKKTVELGIKLNYLGKDDSWELRTNVSDKYREVEIDEILRRLMMM